MIEAASALSASGAGDSLARLAIALSAMPLLGPSFAGRSNNTVSTPALVRCAAICAPMTPAPSTAALRMRSAEYAEGDWRGDVVIGFSENTDMKCRARSWLHPDLGVGKPGDGETNKVLDGLFAMHAFADILFALDDAEAGHGVGQRAGDQVDAPVQLFLAEVRQQAGELGSELAHHVTVVFGQELAQRIVVFREGPRQHAHEQRTAVLVGQLQRGPDERVQRVLQAVVAAFPGLGQCGEALCVERVQTAS